MLVMVALFGILFWAIWSDLITVFSYLDSITLWHYNGTEAGAAVVKDVTMGSLLFAIIAFVMEKRTHKMYVDRGPKSEDEEDSFWD